MFVLREKHFYIRSKISPLARLIHECFMSNSRFHKPHFVQVDKTWISHNLKSIYNVRPKNDMIDGALNELFSTELIKTQDNYFRIASFEKEQKIQVQQGEVFELVWEKIDENASTRRIQSLIEEVGVEEIKRQIKYFEYRQYDWTKSRFQALISFCRDRLPEPKKFLEKKEKENQKKIEQDLEARYSKYRNKLLSKYEFSKEDEKEFIKEAQNKIGILYTGENCLPLRAMIDYLKNEKAGVLSFGDWKEQNEKSQKTL